jgi:hypothetical protein
MYRISVYTVRSSQKGEYKIIIIIIIIIIINCNRTILDMYAERK